MAGQLVMVVDDEEGIRESLKDILSDEGYEVVTADSAERALRMIEERMPELLFLDVWLPGMDGMETLDRVMEMNKELAVILVSGHGNIEMAVKAVKKGAYDFLEKPLSLERVLLAARRAIERKNLQAENRILKESIIKRWKLVGESPAIVELKQKIELAAKSLSRVLITGESGTGKEIVARLLHELSSRAGGAFVEVNCAAIPQELIESELFGHEKGSFTGAFEQKKGKFELADGGTLFLDEIADMSFQTQAKLLRVLETQQFQRVGGSRNIKVDVRVIAATNKNIEEQIRKEQFRDDLFFRLNVIPIEVPPLRERKEDIALLIEHFLDIFAQEHGQARKKISPETMKKLMDHDWPGNIRELRNMLERLVIMSQGMTIADGSLGSRAAQKADDFFSYKTLREAKDAFEREFIIKKLDENAGNISRTAEALEIERSNLHRKIKAYDIKAV